MKSAFSFKTVSLEIARKLNGSLIQVTSDNEEQISKSLEQWVVKSIKKLNENSPNGDLLILKAVILEATKKENYYIIHYLLETKKDVDVIVTMLNYITRKRLNVYTSEYKLVQLSSEQPVRIADNIFEKFSFQVKAWLDGFKKKGEKKEDDEVKRVTAEVA